MHASQFQQVFMDDMNNFVLDIKNKKITVNGRPVTLNGANFLIFKKLSISKNEIVDKETLISIGWPSKFVHPNSLNMAIKSIRELFFNLGVEDIIITHSKKGFSINEKYTITLYNHLESQEESFNKQDYGLFNQEIHGCNCGEDEKSIFFSIKRNIAIISYVVFLILIMFVGVWLFLAKTNVKCYGYQGANFCGVGTFSNNLVKNVSRGSTYVFGYKYPSGDFVYEKIED